MKKVILLLLLLWALTVPAWGTELPREVRGTTLRQRLGQALFLKGRHSPRLVPLRWFMRFPTEWHLIPRAECIRFVPLYPANGR